MVVLTKSTPVTELRPFMRWAGGKSWAGNELVRFVHGLDHGRTVAYCEPFLGGGSYLARMLSEDLILKGHCYIGDLAPEAYLAWKGVLRNPVRTAMEAHLLFNEAYGGTADVFAHKIAEHNYYKMRDEWNASRKDITVEGRDLIELAAKLIVMNRMSFKGLLRVNPSGAFNTPYGHLPTPSLDKENIIAFGRAMQMVGATLVPGSWNEVMRYAYHESSPVAGSSAQAVLAIDPPYAETTHTAYTQRGWTALDRVALSTRCREFSGTWSMFITDARTPSSWDTWRWGGPRPYDRKGGMGDGEGRGRDERGEIIVRWSAN